MLVSTHKLMLTVLAGSALMVSACAKTPGGSYAAQRSASLVTPMQTLAAIDPQPDILNNIESAAGGDLVDAENTLALSGCSYKARLATEDKLGMRWGSENNSRLGLSFGGSESSGSTGSGLKFGYSFKFPSPKPAGKGC
jgi:hypothetical protein